MFLYLRSVSKFAKLPVEIAYCEQPYPAKLFRLGVEFSKSVLDRKILVCMRYATSEA